PVRLGDEVPRGDELRIAHTRKLHPLPRLPVAPDQHRARAGEILDDETQAIERQHRPRLDVPGPPHLPPHHRARPTEPGLVQRRHDRVRPDPDGGLIPQRAVFDDGAGPALFVGGEFETAGGISVENLAKWAGEAWEPATAPPFWSISSGILALAAWDDGAGSALYATSRFEDAAGELGGVARLRDGAWEVLVGSPVGPYAPEAVGPIEVDGQLWMGAAARDRVGAWIDGAWRALGAVGGPGTRATRAMLHVETPSGPRTYLGGRFTLVD